MINQLHYLLMANHTTMQKQIFSKIKHLGLTTGQPKVLDYLYEHDGAIQKDIAIGCYIEPASLSNILNGMEKSELIVRKLSDENRRNMNIFMTEKGKEICEIIRNEIKKAEALALLGLSDEEIHLLHTYLRKIKSNMEASNDNR